MIGLFRALWVGVVIAALVYLGFAVADGLRFDTDMLALVPPAEQEPEYRAAVNALSADFERRFVLLVGGEDDRNAIAAARIVARAVEGTGHVERNTALSPSGARSALLDLYLPYAGQLLSSDDRRRLRQDQGEAIAQRALAQIFSPASFATSRQIRQDPFQLLPAFLASLPPPPMREARQVGPDQIYSDEAGRSWVLLDYRLLAEPYALRVQRRIESALASAERDNGGAPVLRLGTLFFAQSGAETSLREMSLIGGASLAGIVALLVWTFRSIGPVWQSVLALLTGVVCAVAVGTALFPRLHVVALLFGTTLIGTTIDYCMHYFCTAFGPGGASAQARLRHILPGVILGVVTTLIGYAALVLAPFPGLRQIAVVSSAGIAAAALTVLLWFPVLNRRITVSRGRLPMSIAGLAYHWLRRPRYRLVRSCLAMGVVVAGMAGIALLQINDDIRTMQAADARLLDEQRRVREITGLAPALQYILLAAPDHGAALQREERLRSRLERLRGQGAIDGFTMAASFIPSPARQLEDRSLVRQKLEGPMLARQRAHLGLLAPKAPGREVSGDTVLTFEESSVSLPFLKNLAVTTEDGGLFHVVPLRGVKDEQAVQRAIVDLSAARLVDPVGGVNKLLADYRRWAVGILALSVGLMFALLVWRYRLLGGVRALFAPVAAIVLTPGLLALVGHSFSCFDAMALILVLAVGADYAIFCAEASQAWRRVTLLAILLAALTSMLSFGLLAFSSNFAVASFGFTMLVGVLLSLIFAPVAFARPTRPPK